MRMSNFLFYQLLVFIVTVVYINIVNAQNSHSNYVTADISYTSENPKDIEDDNNLNETGSAPKFVNKLMPVIIKPAGNMVRFKCRAEGNPVPNITWYKDGNTPITRNLGTVRYSRWFITLEDLVVNDTASYTCDVCNVLGCINFTYKLEVLERVNHKPIIIETPKNQTVVYGHDCNFTCKYLSDLHSHLEWVVSYNDSQNKTSITDSEPDEILQLRNVTFNDEGWYTCVVSNSLGHSFASAYLKVVPGATKENTELENDIDDLSKEKNVPKFLKQLISSVIKSAENMVRLKCPAEGNHVPNNTQYKDGNEPITKYLGTIRYSRWSINYNLEIVDHNYEASITRNNTVT